MNVPLTSLSKIRLTTHFPGNARSWKNYLLLYIRVFMKIRGRSETLLAQQYQKLLAVAQL